MKCLCISAVDFCSSSSSEATQDTEETSSTGDMETDNAGGVVEGTGNKGGGANAAGGPACKVCGGDRSRNKVGRPEPLIQCAQCESSGENNRHVALVLCLVCFFCECE